MDASCLAGIYARIKIKTLYSLVWLNKPYKNTIIFPQLHITKRYLRD